MSNGDLKEGEAHPASFAAKKWLLSYVEHHEPDEMAMLIETFATMSLTGNRLAEICYETLYRLLNRQPVSDRYLLGLVWTLRDMEDLKKRMRVEGRTA